MSIAARAESFSVPPDGRQSPAALSVCTGARRLLAGYGYASITELTLASGRRADILALGPDGSVWIVEVKSSLADFRADAKWPDYREFCDRFFFAVGPDFRTEVLPEETGIIVADGYGAALLRDPPEHRMAGARRKAVMLRFAHTAANRHHMLVDPAGVAGWMD
jgi:hypothetical protein